MVLALWLSVASAWAVSVADVPNPRDQGAWVSDVAGVIDDAQEQQLNARIAALNSEKGAEIAVVTVPGVDGTPKEFATELFNRWGVGDDQRNDGVLVLLVTGQRRLEVETGVGVEGVLTDGWLGTMQAESMVPLFRGGDYGGGLVAGVDAMAARIASGSGPGAAPSVSSRAPRASAGGVPSGVYAFGVIGGAFVALFGLIVFLVRRGQAQCAECGHPTVLLDEQADDAHLTPAQRMEESLGSVDYDVRLCDHCGAVNIVDREAWFTSYGRCGKCHTRAAHRTSETLVHATQAHGGKVKVTEACAHCGDSHSHTYDTAPLPVIHSSSGRRISSSSSWGSSSRSSSSSWGSSSRSSSSSSRSSSRSSFGGGRSRGGGAGSSW